ncbi:type ISP restriction/modification enzyme [Halomonas sp. KRD171]|uniref:type ISP restriction/modification enzyme n=1 Tax=Halomonas sp. KRD171 TaxID=2729726 RepID=UPI0019D09AD4|nr:type ISP restriction/modification enzyme [Halomonas sp. KRD171]
MTDTFQMYEKDDLVSGLLSDNSDRRTRQKELDIRVIVGNPPYSVGQGSANDNAANVEYPGLDAAIRDSYAAHSKMTSVRNLYDSYIRAFRWGSDRLGDAGVMAFVSGSAWIERSFADGMRKCLVEEFSDLYVLHLRGDIRKNMLSGGMSGEGQNIFGSGSMTGISITLLVKNPKSKSHGNISFYDIGKGLTTSEKLKKIKYFGSLNGVSAEGKWISITPDSKNDWIDQVDISYDSFIEVGSKSKDTSKRIFSTYSLGVASGRDSWAYNSSRRKLALNVSSSIDYYNSEVIRLESQPKEEKEKLANIDEKKFSWNRNAFQDLSKLKRYKFSSENLQRSLYRPFSYRWAYFDRQYNAMVYQMHRIFPNGAVDNLVIQVSGIGARAGFSALLMDTLPNLHTVDSGQCFPLYLYEKPEEQGLFAAEGGNGSGLKRRDAITDEGLAHFQLAYPGETITKEDLFYYIYGLLHSPDYRDRFKYNLAKQMPRIPAVKQAEDFWAFSEAGRKLGELHVNFEEVEPHPVELILPKGYTYDDLTPEHFRVEKKWKFGGTGKVKDKSTVKYNQYITMTGVPLEAYEYVVNGKPAPEWVMERQVVKTDKKSGLVNDANDYATETMNDPAYQLKLFQRVVTVSLETMRIVRGLPTLDID